MTIQRTRETSPVPFLTAPAPTGNGSAPVEAPPGPERRTAGDKAVSLDRIVRVGVDLVALVGAGVAITSVNPWVRLAYGAAAVALLVVLGTYRRRLEMSALEELPRVAEAIAAAVLVVGLASASFQPLPPVMTLAAVSLGTVAAGRFLACGVIRACRRRGLLVPSVIIGAGDVGIDLHRLLKERREYGLDPLGVVDDVEPVPDVPVLGRVDDLDRVVERHQVRRVIVAFGPGGEQRLVSVLRATVQRQVEVYVVPRFFELGLASVGRDVERLWGIPVCRIRRPAIRSGSWWSKRVLDVAVSGALILLTLPLQALIAAAVVLTSRGPVLFRQSRVGQDGRPIEVLKFRSMKPNTDSDTTWTVRDDQRVTAVGRVLRATSLDELPQLWNVLRGDMSVVGPRPERPFFVDAYESQVSGYGDRHRLPAGMTGLAQVQGLRGDTSITERARFDNLYIEYWSPWWDAKILLRTASAVVREGLADLRARRTSTPTTESPTPRPASGQLPATNGNGAGGDHRDDPAQPIRRAASGNGAGDEPGPGEGGHRPSSGGGLDRTKREAKGRLGLLIGANLAVLACLAVGAAVEALVLALAVPVILAILKRPQRGVLLLLAVAPFAGVLDAFVLPAGLAHGWKEALVVLVLGATFVAPRAVRAPTGRRLPGWAPAVVGLFAVSMLSAVAVGGLSALYGLKVTFFYVLLAWAVWRCPPDRRERDWLITILFATGLIAAVYGLVQQLLGGERLHSLGYEYNDTIRFAGSLLRSFSIFSEPFGFGFYMMAVLLVVLPVALRDRHRLRNKLILLCLPLMVAGLLSSVVRASWLGFAIGLTYLGVRRHRGILLLIPLALVGLLLVPTEDLSNSALSADSSEARAEGWADRAQQVFSQPLGLGIGSTGSAAEKAQVLRGVEDPDYYYPDNQYFLYLNELGVLGLWCFVLLLVSVIAALRRSERRLAGAEAALARGAVAMALAAATASVMASYFQIFPLDLLWWALLALVAAMTAEAEGGDTTPDALAEASPATQ